MSEIEDLKKVRNEVDGKIKALEKVEANRLKANEIATKYIQVVCSNCYGTGICGRGGADIESDPPYEDSCGECRGNGYRLKRRFEGNKEYDLTYHEGD